MRRTACILIVVAALLDGIAHAAMELPPFLWAKQDSQLEDDDGKPIGRVRMGDILLGKEVRDARVKVAPYIFGEEGVEGWLPMHLALTQYAALEFFTNTIKEQPENSRAYFGRATVLHTLGFLLSTLRQVTDDLEKAFRLTPTFSEARFWHATVLVGHKAFKPAIEDYAAIIEHGHGTARVFAGRAFCWLGLGDTDKALADVNRAIQLDPEEHVYYRGRAVIFLIAGEPAKALQDSKAARERGAAIDEELLSVEVAALLDSGMYDAAMTVGQKLVEQFPSSSHACAMLATSHFAKGDCSEAIRMYDRALAERDNSLVAMNGKAWVLATCRNEKVRDGEAAVQLARAASRLMKDEFWPTLATLGAAHAEASQFDEAVKWQRKAIELAPKGKKERLEKALKLYESGTPFRSQPGEDLPPWDWGMEFALPG